MGNALFVVWRESLEAFLIAGILYAWLAANDDSRSGRRALFVGLAAGCVLAMLLGWALLGVQDELSGNSLEVFQIGSLLVAAGLITQMVLWMRMHGREIKAKLHADLSAAADRSGRLGIALVAALAVAREGAETVIFLYGVADCSQLDPAEHRFAFASVVDPVAGSGLGIAGRRLRPDDRRRLAAAAARSGLGQFFATRRRDDGRQTAGRLFRLSSAPGLEHATRLGNVLDCGGACPS